MRRFTDPKLVVASHNLGKIQELQDLLVPLGVAAISAAELGLGEPVEDGETFAANARIKAIAAMESSDLPALADDSGLVVHGLGGAPGILSARWARAAGGFDAAMARVEAELNATEANDRSAHFVAALALVWPDGHVENFEGRVDGILVWPSRGAGGFGYDPMFVPDGYEQTFGQMDPGIKHAISHRADAFRKLIDGCFGDQ